MLTQDELLQNGFESDVDGITISILDMILLTGRMQPCGNYIVEFNGETDLFFRNADHLKDFISSFIEAEDHASALNAVNDSKTC